MVSQETAREALIAAARTLRFLAATGLRPATTRKQYAAIDLDTLPERDHVSSWINPASGVVIKLDEPYREIEPLVEKRRSWLEKRGLVMVAPTWDGIYSPGNSHPFFILKDKALGRRLQADVEALAKLPDIEWSGESVPYLDRFVSPARLVEGKLASRRTMPAYPGTVRAGAVAYGGRPGEKGAWRPAEPMPMLNHERASTLLQNLSVSGLSNPAYGLVQQVRSTLEEWVYGEHREVAQDRGDLYYGRDSSIPLGERYVQPALVELIEILGQGYKDCVPRRELIAKLDRALKML